jgi:hypothetical protein
MESNHHVPLGTQGPQAEQAPLARAKSGFQSQIKSGCVRLNRAVSEADWRTLGAQMTSKDLGAQECAMAQDGSLRETRTNTRKYLT